MIQKWLLTGERPSTDPAAVRSRTEPQFSGRVSSIGAKALIGVTGLGLSLFVIVHMLGNLQIYVGPEALNDYARKLKQMPMLLWTARLALLSLFLTHVSLALWLRQRNRAARPAQYVNSATVQASTASRTMIWSGLVILSFLVYHLLHFTLGLTHPEHHHLTDAQGRHDVYAMVVLGFQQPVVAIAYVVAMLLLAVHLSHGISSAFQSLGLNSPRGTATLRRASLIVALVVAAGNISIPVAVLLGLIRLPGGGN